MKKIVALVLALALALSLCTVAFAETTTTGNVVTTTVSYTKGEMYTLAAAGGSMTGPATFTSLTKTTTTGKVEKDVAHYVADKYVVTTGTATATYYAVSKDYATNMLVLDGTKIYLNNSATPIDTGVVFTSKIAAADKVTCGVYVKGETAVAVYVDADGDAFEATSTGDSWGYYNGGFVKYNSAAIAAVSTKPHTFNADSTKTYDSKGKVVTITCAKCDKVFNVVSADDFDTEWKEHTNYEKLGDRYIVLSTVAAGTTTTTTVDSSKTFDAGVAMYVGLSLMSVAGSAVVIGKKKEF